MNMKNLLSNYKTTSAGFLLIIGAVVHLVFAVRNHNADEMTWTTSIGSIVGGIGLIFAGDASKSQQQTDVIKQAVITGDTTELKKQDVPKP